MIFQKNVEKIYRSRVYMRQDNPLGVFYFAPEDFPGLRKHPYSFKSQMGHNLNGFFYHYDDPIPGRLVVFDHGMSNGHRVYMREIETLCKGGYLVFAYDHTGCMTSGGENINGFAQSLTDLDDCINALETVKKLADRSISVMGHSWGGFSTMNIAALHPEITHVVSMAGFISAERMRFQHFRGITRMYIKKVMELDLRQNPKYIRYNAVESLARTEAKVLLIYSADDRTIHKAIHYDPLYEGLKDKENIEFLLVDGRDHVPHYTVDASEYKNRFGAELDRAAKRKQLETPEQQTAFMAKYDWWRMTEQDEAVWARIFAHLKK